MARSTGWKPRAGQCVQNVWFAPRTVPRCTKRQAIYRTGRAETVYRDQLRGITDDERNTQLKHTCCATYCAARGPLSVATLMSAAMPRPTVPAPPPRSRGSAWGVSAASSLASGKLRLCVKTGQWNNTFSERKNDTGARLSACQT